MDLQEVERLASELLATGEMNEDTTADLNRMLDEARSDRLHPDDLSYLRALHARIMLADRDDGSRPEASEATPERADDPETELGELRHSLAEANRSIAELRESLRQANETIAVLRKQPGPGPDTERS